MGNIDYSSFNKVNTLFIRNRDRLVELLNRKDCAEDAKSLMVVTNDFSNIAFEYFDKINLVKDEHGFYLSENRKRLLDVVDGIGEESIKVLNSLSRKPSIDRDDWSEDEIKGKVESLIHVVQKKTEELRTLAIEESPYTVNRVRKELEAEPDKKVDVDPERQRIKDDIKFSVLMTALLPAAVGARIYGYIWEKIEGYKVDKMVSEYPAIEFIDLLRKNGFELNAKNCEQATGKFFAAIVNQYKDVLINHANFQHTREKPFKVLQAGVDGLGKFSKAVEENLEHAMKIEDPKEKIGQYKIL